VAGRYALIVATDAYADDRLRRLRAPAHDAEALAGVLRDPLIGDFDVTLLSNEPESVLRRRIAAFFGDRARDDQLLLHFSCHGLKDDSGQLYFAASDTEVGHLDASAIAAEFVSRQMARSRSSSVLMLLDCCYSGAIARGLTFRAGDTVDVNDHLGGHGRAIITASSAMEYAFEGDDLSGEGQPSVFTSSVVKALRTGEADRDQDHWISVRELYDYVRDEVRELTPNQRPNMLSHLEGELYVARSRYVIPLALPPQLLEALQNPLAQVRAGAVGALAELMRADPRLAPAARAWLERVAADDDSRRVAMAADSALGDPQLVDSPAWEEPPAPTEAPRASVAEPPPVIATDSPPPGVAGQSSSAAAWRPARAVTLDGVQIAALVAALALVLAWFLPWVNNFSPRQLMENYSESQGREGVLEWSIVFAGIAAAALVPFRRAWQALPPVTGWAIGVLGIVLLYSRPSGLDFGIWLAAGACLALVPCGIALALRAPIVARRAPARLPGAVTAVIAALTGVALLVGSYDDHPSAAFRIVVAILCLLGGAATALARERERLCATAASLLGAIVVGITITYGSWGVLAAAAVMTAAAIYAAVTR
jgi:Caspase domain